MYGVFFCQAPSTMFTASLRYTKLFIPSSTVLTYSRFIDLEVCLSAQKEIGKKGAEKNKYCACKTKRQQED